VGDTQGLTFAVGAMGAIAGALITSGLAFVASYLNRKSERQKDALAVRRLEYFKAIESLLTMLQALKEWGARAGELIEAGKRGDRDSAATADTAAANAVVQLLEKRDHMSEILAKLAAIGHPAVFETFSRGCDTVDAYTHKVAVTATESGLYESAPLRKVIKDLGEIASDLTVAVRRDLGVPDAVQIGRGFTPAMGYDD